MKLKSFIPENTTVPRGEPTIAFAIKSGLFRISDSACKITGLKSGQKIVFAQDEERLDSWFIHFSKDKGFVLKKKARVTSGLYFHNSKLAQLIARLVPGFKSDSSRIILRSKSLKYENKILWPLDLSILKNKGK
jgi:hypothetical protein